MALHRDPEASVQASEQGLNLCQPEELGLSCFGCCGHSYKSKQDIRDSIRKNSVEFRHTSTAKQFRDRADKNILSASGICKNVVMVDGQVLCPLHPSVNGQDLRRGHCDIDYLCSAQKEFKTWPHETQKMFIKFIKRKDLDVMTYSLGMDNDSLLKEFKEKHL